MTCTMRSALRRADGVAVDRVVGQHQALISCEWARYRSEEHTSELQSRLHLVCRLLLEKKKKQNNSELLLLSSDNDTHPRGAAHSSDFVGGYYICQVTSSLESLSHCTEPTVIQSHLELT